MKSSKTMRRIQRGEVMVAPEIPLDLLIEIVKRLPIKSLTRFKCVSKLWSSLIHSQGYLFASPPRLYISSIVENKFELSSLSLTSTSKSSIVFDLDLTKQGYGGYHMMVLCGLILYTFSEQAFVYNPTTGQRVGLPAIKVKMSKKNYRKQLNYFFGYDPVLDQYKIVCSTLYLGKSIYAQHWHVFVLEAGSSWKKMEFDYPHCPSRQRLCISGVIYYLTYRSESGLMVISFDVRSEEFNIIKAPSIVNDNWMFCYLVVIEYAGKPTIFDYQHLLDSSGLLNLWVLEDAGNWSRKSLVMQPSQMHLVPDNIRFKVIGTTQNGEVVLKPKDISFPYYILYYDLHKNDVRRVDIRGISEEPLCLVVMDTGESIMHLKI